MDTIHITDVESWAIRCGKRREDFYFEQSVLSDNPEMIERHRATGDLCVYCDRDADSAAAVDETRRCEMAGCREAGTAVCAPAGAGDGAIAGDTLLLLCDAHSREPRYRRCRRRAYGGYEYAAPPADSALDGGSDEPEFTEALIRMRDAENAERNKTICPECGNRFAGDAYGRGCICPKPQMTIRRYSCAECEARPERCYQQGAEVPGIGLRLVYCGCKSPNCGDCVIPGPAKACVDCGMRMARTAIAIRRMRCGECYAAVKRGGYRGVAARDLTREAQERQMAGFTPDYAITTAEALGY